MANKKYAEKTTLKSVRGFRYKNLPVIGINKVTMNGWFFTTSI